MAKQSTIKSPLDAPGGYPAKISPGSGPAERTRSARQEPEKVFDKPPGTVPKASDTLFHSPFEAPKKP